MTKWLYLFIRYFTIVSQMCVSAFFFSLVHLTDVPRRSIQILLRVDAIQPNTSPMLLRHCPAHLVWPLVTTQSLLAAVELVLVWRGAYSLSPSIIFHAAKCDFATVQALYPSRPIYMILGFVVFAETLTLTLDAVFIIPGIHYSPICEVSLPVLPVAIYGCVPSYLL